MSATTSPRVNARELLKHTDKTVRILGRVLKYSGSEATIEASGTITAHLPATVDELEEQQVYEFISKVLDDNTVNVISFQHVGDTIDFDLVDRVIAAEAKHKDLF